MNSYAYMTLFLAACTSAEAACTSAEAEASWPKRRAVFVPVTRIATKGFKMMIEDL